MNRMTQKTIDNILVSNEQKFLSKGSHLHHLHGPSLPPFASGLQEHNNQQHNQQHQKPTFQKRIRTCYRQNQLDILEEAFKQNSYPRPAVKDLLACQTGIDVSRIQVWFQNRRAKQKKQVCQAMRSARGTSVGQNWQYWRGSTRATSHHQLGQLQQQQQPALEPQLAVVQVPTSGGACGGLQQNLAPIESQIFNQRQEPLSSFYQQHENINQQQALDASALVAGRGCDNLGQQIIQHSHDQGALSSSLAAAANFRQQYQHIQLQQQQQQQQQQFRQSNQHFSCYHKQLGAEARQSPVGKYSSSAN